MMLLVSKLARQARRPSLVIGMLAMLAGFHFLGGLGFAIAFIGFALFNVAAGHFAREQAARRRLRQSVERDELP